MITKVSETFPGSLELLEEIIKNNNIKIDTGDMMVVMPSIVSTMEYFHRSLFTGFYWRKMTKTDLVYLHGIKINEINKELNLATNEFINKLKSHVNK